jgi:hypothetical protein
VATANAVARSYVANAISAGNPLGQLLAQLFQPAASATGTTLAAWLFGGARFSVRAVFDAIIQAQSSRMTWREEPKPGCIRAGSSWILCDGSIGNHPSP